MKKHRIKHGVKRLLAAMLAIMLVLGTCSGYLPVPEVNGECATLKEEENRPEPEGDAAPGTIGMLNPYLDGQSLTIYKNESDTGHTQPQIIYGTFMENGQRVTRSLYCIDFAKTLQSGTGFAEGTDYARLNERQKQAVAQVLGKTKILDAPRNAEGGFDHTGNLVAWQEYVATQLLIWYYIDRYYTQGTCEGIGWYGVERACADGYASLEYCNMVREYVDALDKIPGFAGEQRETAPEYKLKYNHTSACYETVLTDTNGVFERFDFENTMQEIICEKAGNQLRIKSNRAIEATGCAELTGVSRADMGIVTYVTAVKAGVQPLIRCDGVVPQENHRVYLKVYTESLGGIRVYKQAITHMTTPYSVQGAVYGVFKTKADAEANVNPVAAIRIDRKDMAGNDYGEVDKLVYGTYYVRETEGPQDEHRQAVGHWLLDQTIYKVNVKEAYDPELHIGSPAGITSKEQNYTAAIRVNKVSALPAINNDPVSLIGAVYGVYDTYEAAEKAKVQYASTAAAQLGAAAEGAEATIVIKKNPDGIYGQIDGLPLDTYYVKEIYAPNGWLTEEAIHTVDVGKRNKQTFITTGTLTSRETPEHSIIYVGKIRKENPFDVLGRSFEMGAGGTAGMLGAEYGIFKTREDAQKAQVKAYDDGSAYEDNRITTIITDRTNGSTILGGPDLSAYSVYGESEELPKGTYYIVETKAPKGWLLDRQIYRRSTTGKLPNGIYYALVNSREVEKSGIIELYKTDAAGGERTADATLKGAKYGIYVEKTPGSSELKRIEGGEIITDEAGYGCIEGLPEGVYYVKEEIPSPGYQLDQNIYPVEITPKLIADVKPVVKVESREIPILTDYEIKKITEEDNTGVTEPTPLAGCVFALYLKSELDSERLETDETGDLRLKLAYGADGKAITEGTVLEDVKPYYTAVTGKDGKAIFKDCYPGDYLVVELTIGNRGDGNVYRAIRPYEISLPVTDGTGSNKSRETVTLTDEFAGEYLKIQKLDQTTGKKINGRVEFRIYDLEQKQYVSLSVDGKVRNRFATDESGCIRFDSRISQGHYRLEEVAAPEYYEMKEVEIRVLDGYLEYRELSADRMPAGEWHRGETEAEDGRVVQIIRVEDMPYRIQVEKVDEAGEPLYGATLAIAYADTDGKRPAVDADGHYEILKLVGQTEIRQQAQQEREREELQPGETQPEEAQPEPVEARWTTTETKQIWEYVPRGNYFLVELEAPDGYAIADPIPFMVNAEPVQTITMVDRKMTGRAAVAKTGPVLVGAEQEETGFGIVWHLQYEQRPMEGITFTIYEDGTDREVCSFVTGPGAVTYSPELDLTGNKKYYMMETAAPAGVVMSKDKYPCEMIYDEDAAGYVTEIIKVENQVMDAEILLYKQGESAVPLEDGTWTFEPAGLAGVWFGVYAAEEVLNAQGEEVVKKDSLVGIGMTDREGCCSIREALPAGNYYWKELKTIDGYILEENSYGFELTYPPDQTETGWKIEVNKEQPLMNRLYKARIILNKKGDDDKKLQGVTFALFRDGKKVGEYVTGKDGRIEIEQLPYGRYYFKEIKGILGYLFDEELKYEFAVEAKDDQIIELNIVNKKEQELPVPITGDSVSMLAGLLLLMTSILTFIFINGRGILRRKRNKKRP